MADKERWTPAVSTPMGLCDKEGAGHAVNLFGVVRADETRGGAMFGHVIKAFGTR